ncbi:hypothetical protein BK133_09490 [Paenibacillus sp. FSL H8-0548]|uniref:hypothetical protein n=1 Tax=Paenibacillus sp. FSL H8-0548 TaxID=1920422 RepID=UPI00096FD15B|nr:hypothetical protein [Paenibacillus sp. FSL H8-0548]OMF35918.1 hypothetical protein BK133_09490 [Paenibacillus sp. FSL H8-0548]
MMIMIGAALIVGAFLIGWISKMSDLISRIFDVVAAAAVFVFYVTAADAVMETLANDTVFMTEVHKVLENAGFLASGAYLGPYILARIAMLPAYLFGRK